MREICTSGLTRGTRLTVWSLLYRPLAIRKAIIPKFPEEPSVAIVPRSAAPAINNILITLY
jgi:hypothetical protein